MKTDIRNRKDLVKLVNTFYDKIKTDEVIGYFFTDIAQVNWEKHLTTMYDFWENSLFYTGNYNGNPMMKHTELHEKSPFNEAHFNQWTTLFTDTVNQLFEGPNSEKIKSRAINISMFMRRKFSIG